MNPTYDRAERIRPCVRLMIYITTFDDYFELTPVKELKLIADRVYEVMIGEDPLPHEIGIFRQMAQARKEWVANGMPLFTKTPMANCSSLLSLFIKPLDGEGNKQLEQSLKS
ncbi:MAG TPA: hypothetical protein VN040_20540 [Pseudosphingobacterium sp.]|nr:hypothetical protein [Pseudosphingobacterium sp.]